MSVHKQLHVYAKYFSSLVMNGGLSLFKDFKIHLLTLGPTYVQANDLQIFATFFFLLNFSTVFF